MVLSEQQQMCPSGNTRPVILTFVGNYLPGFKAGGILRSVVNTVSHLADDFEFMIVTKDRDLGDEKPYSGVLMNQWLSQGNARVYYLPPEACTVGNISSIIKTTPHDLVYLNSFFEPLTIKVLVNRKFSSSSKPVILSPRGEFAWASLKIRYPKKFVFLKMAKLLGLYSNLIWHASSTIESSEIEDIMGISHSRVRVALDLPAKLSPESKPLQSIATQKDSDSFRILFLSRISPEKNLDYALSILVELKTTVEFHIYGPVDDMYYWNECQQLIKKMPHNIHVEYHGAVSHAESLAAFSLYDLFFLPSGGENFGHVIAESLSMGTPVLISDKTPWKDLEKDGIGWAISLDQRQSFVDRIERCSKDKNKVSQEGRTLIRTRALNRINDPVAIKQNKDIFFEQLDGHV